MVKGFSYASVDLVFVFDPTDLTNTCLFEAKYMTLQGCSNL